MGLGELLQWPGKTLRRAASFSREGSSRRGRRFGSGKSVSRLRGESQRPSRCLRPHCSRVSAPSPAAGQRDGSPWQRQGGASQEPHGAGPPRGRRRGPFCARRQGHRPRRRQPVQGLLPLLNSRAHTCALTALHHSLARALQGSHSHQHQDEPSVGRDSSTHSALFDLELSTRGRAGDLLARLNPAVADEHSTHASGDPSVRLSTGLLQRVIYLGRPVMEFELDVRTSCCLSSSGRLAVLLHCTAPRCVLGWGGRQRAGGWACSWATLPLLSSYWRCARGLTRSRRRLPAPTQLLQDLRALRPACSLPDGELDLSALVAGLQERGYACHMKQNNPGAVSAPCRCGRSWQRVHLLAPWAHAPAGALPSPPPPAALPRAPACLLHSLLARGESGWRAGPLFRYRRQPSHALPFCPPPPLAASPACPSPAALPHLPSRPCPQPTPRTRTTCSRAAWRSCGTSTSCAPAAPTARWRTGASSTRASGSSWPSRSPRPSTSECSR